MEEGEEEGEEEGVEMNVIHVGQNMGVANSILAFSALGR